MIPKKIHYCWFGKNPLPESAKKCIESWKKYMSDYEIIEWNENNYDVHRIPYIAQAYENKKYAFVSDYARFDILYEHGGIYFDTDVEVLKDVTELCNKGNWCGVESTSDRALNAGLGIAAQRREPVFKEILNSYKDSFFINEDGSFNLYTVVERVSDIFRKYGFKSSNEIQFCANFYIYPKEYFCPKDCVTGILNITENTYTIHHYDASWVDKWRKDLLLIEHKRIEKYGNTKLVKVTNLLNHVFSAFKNLGFINGFKYCYQKLIRG